MKEKILQWIDSIKELFSSPSVVRPYGSVRKKGPFRKPSAKKSVQKRTPIRKSAKRSNSRPSSRSQAKTKTASTRSTPKKKPTVKKALKKTVKKKAVKKPVRKQSAAAKRKSSSQGKSISPTNKAIKTSTAKVNSPLVGEITHYFAKIKVVVVKVTKGPLKVGDRINIKGKGTDFIQDIDSMQIESVDVKSARKGQLVGLKVKKAVKVGDKVFKVA